MPTTARRRNFLRLAVGYFLQQSYQAAELVIVDDQDSSDLPPETNPKIKYLQSANKSSFIGFKRNEACQYANGEIIIHLDDDDWYAPDWISKQVELFQKNDAELCGLNRVLFYNHLDNKAWQYKYLFRDRDWVYGATLAYRKSLWERHNFKNMQVGEDNDFVWHSGAKIVHQTYGEGYVGMVHGGNTSPKVTVGSCWSPYPVAEIHNILKQDLDGYNATELSK